jgi:hypothetical protein
VPFGLLSEGGLFYSNPPIAPATVAISPQYDASIQVSDGTDTFALFSPMFGYWGPGAQVYIPDGIFGCSADAGLPPDADPPFPPVYPYPFVSDLLYGKEHLDVTIRMIRGDTYEFVFRVVQDGDSFPITGATFWMTAKWDVEDADLDAVFQISTADDIAILSESEGRVGVIIKPAKTIGLPAHIVTLPYDIQMKASGGEIYTVLRGTLVVTPDVTVDTS